MVKNGFDLGETYTSCAGYDQLCWGTQLVHSQDGDAQVVISCQSKRLGRARKLFHLGKL